MNPLHKFRMALKQSAGVSTDHIGTNQVPANLEIAPTGQVIIVEDQTAPKVVKAHDYFVQVGTDLADGLVADDRPKIVLGLENTLENVSFQANLDESTQAVTRPQNTVTLLDPAMVSLTDSWPALNELAKNAVQDQSLTDLQARHAYIQYLWAIQKKVNLFSEILANTIALAETDLVKRLRGIYQKCSSTCLTNRRVQGLTEALVALFTKSAQDAVDQRKNNDKVASDTRAQVQAENPPQSQPQQPPVQAGGAGNPGGTVSTGHGTVGIPAGGQVVLPQQAGSAAPASARTAPRGKRKKQP